MKKDEFEKRLNQAVQNYIDNECGMSVTMNDSEDGFTAGAKWAKKECGKKISQLEAKLEIAEQALQDISGGTGTHAIIANDTLAKLDNK